MRDELVTWIVTVVWIVFGGYHGYMATRTTAVTRLVYLALAILGLVLSVYWTRQGLRSRGSRTW